MLPRKSRFSAQAVERPRLAPVWLIGLLAAIVGFTLFLLYPRSDLERRLAANPDTALSAAYLENLLRSDPNNPQLRLLLARRQLQIGQIEAARITLQPALVAPESAVRGKAHWVLFEISEQEYRNLPATANNERYQKRQELLRQMQKLADQPKSIEEQIELAGKAYQYNHPGLGGELFKSVARRINDPERAHALFESAAKEALANGDYRGCAELYLLARNNSRDRSESRRLFHAALRALQSGNQPLSAVELGEREIGELAEDNDTLLLMTHLARAAGRPDIADRYVRKLLRISLLQQWQALQVAHAWGEGSFRKVSATGQTGGPGIAFDDKIFTLGYEVFLENRKLEDAWQVASAAVRQAPEDLNWRERLARVAEWTQRPQLALENWLKIAQATQKDDAWQAVLRLAPGLFDDAALIAALHYQIARKPQDLRLIRELVAAYERLGEPRPAIHYLQRLSQRNARPEILELLAELAERAGDTDISLQSWQRLFADPGQITAPRALRVAVMLLLKGRGAEGLRWLERAQSRAGLSSENDVEFWRLSGQLAELQQKDSQAITAFRRLIDANKADAGDYDALIRLLTYAAPLEAARISARAWQEFDEPRYLIQSLTIYVGRNRWEEISALLRALDPAENAPRRALRKLWQLPEFLRLAGTYQQNIGRLAEARRHFEAGLRLAPDSTDMQQALLWLFIDSNDAVSLRKLLASHELKWRENPAMHDALAASYQALSLPQVALQRYLTPHVADHRDDFIWLMNYADALDQNQQSDRAWRLRRNLLSEEWQAGRGTRTLHAARQRWLTEAGLDQTRRIARTRLLLTQRPGDVGLDALRELLRLDNAGQASYSNAAAETAIGWLQDHAEYTAERGFLWHQYARSRSSRANRPLWAEITVALAEQDKAATGELLEAFDERLPRYDRVNAARAVDALRLAQTAAFETQNDQTDDDTTHLQLTETLLAFSDHAGFSVTNRQLGSLDERPVSTTYHLAIDPRLSLDFEWGRIQRHARREEVIRNAPSELLFSTRLAWRHPDGETVFRADQRESFARYTPLQIEHEQRLDDRLSLRMGFGTQLPSQDSLPLRVAGMKDRASISVRYRPTRLDQIFAEHWREQYQLQTGGNVGSGYHNAVTYAHTYRQEARDLEFSAFWSNHNYSRRDDFSGFSTRDARISRLYPADFIQPAGNGTPGPEYFLPDDFSFYGIRLSTDVRYEQEYTRATRPFASIARTWHSKLGPGYDLRLGLAGSVLGADHLAMSWGLGKSGMQQTGGLVRDLQLTYRIHY